MSRPKFLPENFTLALIATVVAASVLPCRASAALAVDHLTVLAIALLFKGLWHQVPPSALAGLLVADGVLLAAALITTGLVSRWLGFERADRAAIIFCGSKMSLSQGVTLAKVIFASHEVGRLSCRSWSSIRFN